MKGYCKNCKWWEDGACDFVDTIHAKKKETRFEVECWANDDTDLGAKVMTGPDFGCIHFKAK